MPRNTRTESLPWWKVLDTDFTTGAPTVSVLTSEPVHGTDAVWDLQHDDLGWSTDGQVPKHMSLLVYGTNAENETVGLDVVGYRKLYNANIWVPTLILDVTVTLGTLTGTPLGTGVLLGDTYAMQKAYTYSAQINNGVSSPANDLPGALEFDTRGFRYLQFVFGLGTAASANALICPSSDG